MDENIRAAGIARVQPTTPFPNLLLDQVMPSLKDTEWRLLCVIVRQTLGWWDGKTGERKTSDWLTQRQFIKRTGRSSEALSRALDSLVRQNLIEVQSRTGRPLDSPSERRQARGCIRYALHPRFLDTNVRLVIHKSEYHAPKHTFRNLLLRGQGRKSEYGETAKANGTKENTKETSTKGLTPLSTFVKQYQSEYRARGHGIMREPSKMSLDSLAQLLDRHSTAELNALRDAFFACDVQSIVRRGYTLDSFVDGVNLLAFAPRKSSVNA